MSIESAVQLANTQTKLKLIEEQIASARRRPRTAERDESIGSLVEMANQLKEEIVRYRSREKLKTAGLPAVSH